MEVYPQFRYEWGEFVRKFPKNMFIPGLYIPYPLYEEIDKPENYKTIYVLRDPREVISSWYYSMKYSHEIMGKVGMHRKRLKSMSEKKGITYCIKRLQIKMSFVRSWVYNSHDPNVIFVKFENLTNERVKEWKKLFSFLKINIDKSSIKSILNKYTKEKMRKSMKENKRFSHYTKNRKSWEKLFGNNHIEMFKKVNGNIVKMLDYSW